MGDKMRSVPFGALLERVFGELRLHGSVFSIPSSHFHKAPGGRVRVFSQEAEGLVGPAAGPHSQLAQNIITSYLAGGRFIELKTVQDKDDLVVKKPCIDARDEGYNVEWSSEYSLPKAYDEYLKAWIVTHVFDILFHEDWKEPHFIFNASVGYTLAGIQGAKMNHYLDSLADADVDGRFDGYIAILDEALKKGLFEGTPYEGREGEVRGKLPLIGKRIASSLTVSTMHGCPPGEIEAVCRHLIGAKGFDVFVKLNPTLLGYDEVRRILDSLGYDYLALKPASFEADLQWKDAASMLERLEAYAAQCGHGFGVKLTNTLSSINNQGVLPASEAEMYMSGRALLPISTGVALKISRHFSGRLPISFSGGVGAPVIKELCATGIKPITLATGLLQPGGYLKLGQLASLTGECGGWDSTVVDVPALQAFYDKVTAPEGPCRKDARGVDSVKLGRPLPLLDCYVAPCVEACPIHQDIPEYVALMGEGRYAEALAVILDKNALPNITGWICDHQCQRHCSRMDMEGPIAIREVKKIAAKEGREEYLDEIWTHPGEPADVKAAVVGAGPAGLATAFFLARAGFDVSLFDKAPDAGGVVSSAIPEFRIPAEVVKADVDFILSNGVKAHFSVDPASMEPDALRAEGFDWLFYAIGAEKARDPGVKGNGTMLSAVSFLQGYKKGQVPPGVRKAVVMGGGNTAMDAARAARSLGWDVTVAYRRSRAEMPADREEYEAAIADGVDFLFLTNPKDFTDGRLTAARMVLGEADASGRRRPVESGESVVLDADILISAVGESADLGLLEGLSLEADEGFLSDADVYVVGDAVSGPSTVVRAMASARAAVDDCIDRVLDELGEADDDDECDDDGCSCGHDHEHDECGCGHHHDDDGECGCGHHHHDDEDEDEDELDDEEYRQKEDAYFASIINKKASIDISDCGADWKDFLAKEASRCLECSYLCNKCVDVCPNRANVAIDLRDSGLFEDPFQILHIDAYCNECGNCETFCPYSGGPYKKKFTLFSSKEDFLDSENEGFLVEGDTVTVRRGGRIVSGRIDEERDLEIDLDEEALSLISEVFISYPYLLTQVDRD